MKKNILINKKNYEINILERSPKSIQFEINKKSYHFELQSENCGKIYLRDKKNNNCGIFGLKVSQDFGNSSKWHFVSKGKDFFIEIPTKGKVKKKSDEEGHMLSPMPGQIVKVLVKEGDKVQKNDPLVVLEAMKMEHTIRSNCEGTVLKVFFNHGDLVGGEVELLELEAKKE
jgi:biotin carboxyl carrier protein